MIDTNTENEDKSDSPKVYKESSKFFPVFLILVFLTPCIAYFWIMYYPEMFVYTPRTRVAEGLVLASGYKNYVVDYYVNHDQFPHGTLEEVAEQVGAPIFQSTANTKQITVLDGGVIEIESTKRAAGAEGKKLFLIPSVGDQGRIEWRCVNGTGDAAFVNLRIIPSECR